MQYLRPKKSEREREREREREAQNNSVLFNMATNNNNKNLVTRVKLYTN